MSERLGAMGFVAHAQRVLDGGRVDVGLSARPFVFFDFDGTLADTKPSIIATARATLAEWGMTDEEMGDLDRLIGPPFPRAYCDIYGMSMPDAEELTRRYRARYAQLGRESHPLFDGMAELLRDLVAAGRTLAVTSSKRQEFAESMLADEGVLDLFAAVVAQRDPAHADKPYLVRATLEALGATPDRSVMVGDRFYDVEGAKANGVPCIGVLFGTATRAELEGAGAAAVVESVGELCRVLLG